MIFEHFCSTDSIVVDDMPRNYFVCLMSVRSWTRPLISDWVMMWGLSFSGCGKHGELRDLLFYKVLTSLFGSLRDGYNTKLSRKFLHFICILSVFLVKKMHCIMWK